MADENVEEPNEDNGGEKKSSGGKMGLILVLVAMVLAVGGGLGIYFFVIAPKLAPPGDGDVVTDQEPEDFIPEEPEFVYFESSFIHLMREGTEPAATLLYKVTFECTDLETAELITRHKARFIDMLNKLHGSRTRDEVDDIITFEQSIQRQALQQANDILKRLSKDDDSTSMRVTAVFHEQLMVSDPQV